MQALSLHMSKTAMGASQKDFESAMNQVKLLKKDPGNEVKLKLYALYKQVNIWGLMWLRDVLGRWPLK